MARVIGQAGRGAAVEAIFGAGEPVVLSIPVVLLLSLAAVEIHSPLGWMALGIGLLIDAFLLRRSLVETFRHAFGSRAWWRGFEGERRTGQALATLPDDYVVFHDFAFRNGDDWHPWNVDHIVVGPTGVFVLETKNSHRRRIRPSKADARTERDVRQVKRNATDLKKLLNKWSDGQLAGVFVEGWVVYSQEEAHVEELWDGQTHVVPVRLLSKHIQGRRKRDVDSEQAYRVVRALFSQLYPQRIENYRDVMQTIEDDQKRRVAKRIEEARAKRAQGVQQTEPVEETCPWCGAALKQKTAHRGKPDEHEFMSCTRFPACRFGYDLPNPVVQAPV